MPANDEAEDRAYVLAQHAALRQLLVERAGQIDEMVRSAEAAAAGVELICRRLDEYFDGQRTEELDHRLQARFPRLQHAIEKLRDERAQLAQRARSTVQRASDTAAAARQTSEDFHTLQDRFAGHEHRGNALLQEAYNVDLGAED